MPSQVGKEHIFGNDDILRTSCMCYFKKTLGYNVLEKFIENDWICPFIYKFAGTRALYRIGIYPLTGRGHHRKTQSRAPIIVKIASIKRLQSTKLNFERRWTIKSQSLGPKLCKPFWGLPKYKTGSMACTPKFHILSENIICLTCLSHLIIIPNCCSYRKWK